MCVERANSCRRLHCLGKVHSTSYMKLKKGCICVSLLYKAEKPQMHPFFFLFTTPKRIFRGVFFHFASLGRQAAGVVDYSKQPVFELGVLIHEMATGQSPFEGKLFFILDSKKDFLIIIVFRSTFVCVLFLI